MPEDAHDVAGAGAPADEGAEGVHEEARVDEHQERGQQVIVKEEAPWITLAHSVRFDPLRKEVQGYKMDATAHHYFTNVDLAKQP